MKTTKTYLSGCTWCRATGLVPNEMTLGSTVTGPLTKACPVCNGAKVIMVTEVTEPSNTDEQAGREKEPDINTPFFGNSGAKVPLKDEGEN